MKKFLLLVAIIYFASCKSFCDGVEKENATITICHDAQLEKENDQCCYFEKGNDHFCMEFINTMTADDIKNQNATYKDYVIDCPYKGGNQPSSGNYLKAGLLLVAMLLL